MASSLLEIEKLGSSFGRTERVKTAKVATLVSTAVSSSGSSLGSVGSHGAKMPSERTLRSMKSFRRQSTTEEFVLKQDQPMPELQAGGAIIKVCYAGACYTNGQLVNSGQKRPRMTGVMDTSLFPGFEVSGVVEEICPTIKHPTVDVGDRVIVYPTDEEEFTDSGYAEYISVKDANNLVRLPDNLALDVAAILPCGALSAHAAVLRVKPMIQERLLSTSGVVNVLIVGAGGLGLWTVRLAEYHIASIGTRVRLIVADSSVEKLMIAKAHGCKDVVHWDESLHEEYLQMRTKNACKGGIDVAIDFVSSARTVGRTIKVLKDGGVLVVGGNSKFDVSISLYSLAMHSQSIIGVHRGTRAQLAELTQLVANEQIKPPVYSVFPVDDANRVFHQLSHCRLNGRAVLRVCSADDDSVFFSSSQDQLMRANISMPATMPESPEEEDMSPAPMSPSSATGDTKASGGAFFLPNPYQE